MLYPPFFLAFNTPFCVIEASFGLLASFGLFFNRNNVGNKMINIYNKNGIQIDICYDYGYFEILGLNSLQKTELTKFYENLK